jgi:hypothetical protein
MQQREKCPLPVSLRRTVSELVELICDVAEPDLE